jgi:Secretion system C-terminal sorting domain/Cleaved Adhesin Domain
MDKFRYLLSSFTIPAVLKMKKFTIYVCMMLLSALPLVAQTGKRIPDAALETAFMKPLRPTASVAKSKAPLLSENFTATTFPPPNWTVIDADADDYFWVRSGVVGSDGTAGRAYMPYNDVDATVDKDDWLITPGVTLMADSTYRLKFHTMILNATYPERFEVKIGNAATVAAMTTVIAAPTDVATAANAWTARIYDFTPSVTGTYYIGFHAISDADMYNLYIDTVTLDRPPVAAPTCVEMAVADSTLNAPVAGFNYEWNYSTVGGIPNRHDVYFGTSSNPPKVKDNAAWASNYATGALMKNQRYYIKVVAKNNLGESTSCKTQTFWAEDAPNAGGGSENPFSGGYYFANSLAAGNLHNAQPTYSWIDMAAGTRLVLADDSVGVAPIPLPFTFPYFGKNITHVCVSSNGFMYMRTSNAACPTASAATNLGIPVASVDGGIMALFWDDLDPSKGGTIRHLNSATGKFVLAFEGIQRYNLTPNATDVVTAQLVLFPSGKIRMQYNLPATTVVNSASAGIVDVNGSNFIRYADDGAGGPLRSSPVAVAYAQTIAGLASDVATAVSAENPDELSVMDAYPNPFTAQTTLNVQIPRTQNVVIELYNVLGQKVSTLFEGNLAGGQPQTLSIDAKNLSNGQYFVRLSGENFVQHQTLTIIK